jgi:hypothetical protein
MEKPLKMCLHRSSQSRVVLLGVQKPSFAKTKACLKWSDTSLFFLCLYFGF